jgi:hypothetical protein
VIGNSHADANPARRLTGNSVATAPSTVTETIEIDLAGKFSPLSTGEIGQSRGSFFDGFLEQRRYERALFRLRFFKKKTNRASKHVFYVQSGREMPTSNRSVSHPWSKRVSATSRTAVYGPVCTVVWEGRSREAPPIPISGPFADISLTKVAEISGRCFDRPGFRRPLIGGLRDGRPCGATTSEGAGG